MLCIWNMISLLIFVYFIDFFIVIYLYFFCKTYDILFVYYKYVTNWVLFF